MLRALLSFRGLILVFCLVAVGLPIALIGQLGIVRTLTEINQEVGRIRTGQLTTSDVLRYQLDEETGLRGYAATGRSIFLEPYARAKREMRPALDTLAVLVHENRPSPGRDDRAVTDMRRVNALWLKTVAAPIIAGSRDERLLLRGKTLVDRFRADSERIDRLLTQRYRSGIARRERTIQTSSIVSVVAIAAIALEVIVFAAVLSRMRFELDRERGFAETLQTAASVRIVSPAYLAVASAYRSATRGARVGGDLYDVYRLDPDRTLIVMGDVSGKGLGAAIDTTFVRFAIRTLASEGLTTDQIVRRFDTLYREAQSAPESFVTMFVGIHNRRDASLAYTNAGHEGCWIRRNGRVAMLAPTAPVVGVGGFEGVTFERAQTPFAAGDLLVLATDGLTEARNPHGEVVPADLVVSWLTNLVDTTPQAVVDRIMGMIKLYTRNRINDDLAVLAIENRS